MKAKIVIIISVTIILVIGFTIAFLGRPQNRNHFGPSNNGGQENNQGFRQSNNLPSCGVQRAFFSQSPLADTGFMSITPLGNVAPPDHTFPTPHTYMDLANRAVAAPIVAPGDILITKVSTSQSANRPGQSYSIDFSVCAEVSGYFIHINVLADDLLQQIGEFKNCDTYNPGSGNYTSCYEDVAIKLTAGDPIGFAGGPTSDGSAALDWGLRDTRLPGATFLHASNRTDQETAFTACPYDYFEPGPAQDLVNNKLRASSNITPACGTIDQDIAGTAQGRWFSPEFTFETSEAGHLSLIPSNINTADNIISIGNPQVGVGLNAYTTRPSGQINRSFKEIKSDGKIYCFENLRSNTNPGANRNPGIIFLSLADDNTLTIEKSPTNTCPSNPNSLSFTQRAVTFKR